MQDLETECLKKIGVQLIFYYRYVNDIVLVAPSDKIDLILKTFNNYHDIFIFILERENNRSLSFLDLILTISNNTIILIGFTRRRFLEDFCLSTPP